MVAADVAAVLAVTVVHLNFDPACIRDDREVSNVVDSINHQPKNHCRQPCHLVDSDPQDEAEPLLLLMAAAFLDR